MKPCTRIEIVIEAPMAPRLVELLKAANAPGYTLVPEIRGQGDRGLRWADELSGDSSNCLCLIACDDAAIVQAILDKVRPLLSRYGGICLVSEAQWLRH